MTRDAPAPTLRSELRADDDAAVARLVAATGVFSPDEQAIAVELVTERRAKGIESGYHFVFAERDGQVLGYTCFGPIPATRSSFDLYWIAVDTGEQRTGLGRRLVAATEQAIAALGGTRIYIDTSSRTDYAPARAFYQRMGYGVAAEFESFYAPGDGKVVFCKALNP